MDRIIRTLLAYILTMAALFCFWYSVGHPIILPEPVLSSSHKLPCVSYAPFEKNQSPLDSGGNFMVSDKRIDSDLAILSRKFAGIRTYSITGLESIPDYAEKYGMHVLLGAWVSADPVMTQQELQKVVELARKHPSSVQAIVVGNEALLRSEVTGQQLAGYIRQVKSALPEVPVTYADVWEFWLKHPEIAPVVDFVTIHILPYWEDNPVSVDSAMSHIRKIREEVARQLPGKDILIGETGWPSEGRMRKGAVPSRENQARFIRSFVSLAEQEHWRYNLIEAFDQPWKRAKEGEVGGYWGLYDKDRQDKNVLSGPVSNFPNWRELFRNSVVIVLLTLFISYRYTGMNRVCWLLFSAAMSTGAVLLVMQGQQFSLSARNIWEYLWAVGVLLQAAIAYGVALYAIASRSVPSSARLEKVLDFLYGRSRIDTGTLISLLRLGVISCTLIAAMGLLFDARYRAFNICGFIVPAIVFFWLSLHQKPQMAECRILERWAALILIITALGVLINETTLNRQADIWAGVCLLLAYPLWKESKGTSLRPLLPCGIWVIIGYAVFAAIRYGILNSGVLASACADRPDNVVCVVRSILGMMMYHQVFGWTSLLLAGLAAWRRTMKMSVLAITACLSSLALYNVDTGAVATVITGFTFVYEKFSTHRES